MDELEHYKKREREAQSALIQQQNAISKILQENKRLRARIKELESVRASVLNEVMEIPIVLDLNAKIKQLEAEVRNAKQQGSLENTHDMIELLEAYVLCPEEELTEDAIKTIREPILKVLRTKWNMEVTKVSDSVGKEYVVYSYQDNPKDRKEK